jgi:hypothetical protein
MNLKALVMLLFLTIRKDKEKQYLRKKIED